MLPTQITLLILWLDMNQNVLKEQNLRGVNASQRSEERRVGKEC